MYIIADVEWVQNEQNKQSPTQLAAVRVDDEWNIIDDFTAYIRPMDASFHDWNHVAYTGGKPDDFLYARNCHNVFAAFEKWAGEDILCWWFKPSHDLYTLINKIVLKNKSVRQAKILGEYMPGFLDGQGHVKGSAYKLARARDIVVPEVEHDSKNDVLAIVNLLKGIAFPQASLLEAPIKPVPKYNHPKSDSLEYQYDVTNALLHKKGCPNIPEGVDLLGFGTLIGAIRKGYKACYCVKEDLRLAKREKVLDEINRSQYTFMYAEDGSIFHRHDCGLLHNAHHVLGTIKYDTIIKKGLRPCKVCNPSPEDEYRPVLIQQKITTMKTPKMAKRSLTRQEMTAMTRLQQSQKERFSGVLHTEMTKQEKADLFTLTQPRFGFFAARGYQTFHTRNCNRLLGKSNIRGFDTYSHACRAGYTPCKYCRPSEKQNVVVSIPIDNKIRTDETVEDLSVLCDQYGYLHHYYKGDFELETPVGKWIIHTGERPVTVEHINLAKKPNCEIYHKQHRIFLSMLDALRYIHRHDSELKGESEENAGTDEVV